MEPRIGCRVPSGDASVNDFARTVSRDGDFAITNQKLDGFRALRDGPRQLRACWKTQGALGFGVHQTM